MTFLEVGICVCKVVTMSINNEATNGRESAEEEEEDEENEEEVGKNSLSEFQWR